MVYPIMEWLLHRIPDLKKRAYLAKFLVKVEVPAEIMAEDQIHELYAQVRVMPLVVVKQNPRLEEEGLPCQVSCEGRGAVRNNG